MVRIGSTALVLAPLTPDGSQTYLEILAATSPDEMNLAALSYTLPPESWADNWEQYVGSLPETRAFFHAGRTLTTAQDGREAAFEDMVVVDPTDPMEAITAIEDRLSDWQSTGRPTVISLQTLTILLQYVDFDTAFRYLHLLVHKIRASEAVGYVQIDPHLHDSEQLNTLKALFDTVIAYSESEERWVEVDADDEVRALDSATGGDSPDTDNSVFARWKAKAARLLGGDSATASPEPGELSSGPRVSSSVGTAAPTDSTGAGTDVDSGTGTTSDADSTGADSADRDSDDTGERPDTAADEAGEDLLTDDERIKRLLHQSGGQMRQADLAEMSPWSESTVSRKLSQMEDDGTISRIRIGRENVVFLDGREPDAVRPPADRDEDTQSALGSK